MKRGCALAAILLFALGSVRADPDVNVVASIDFGQVIVGKSGIKALMIGNTGDSDLVVTNITMSDGDAPPKNDFDVPLLSGDFPPAFPITIAAGDSKMFDVIYSPSAVGMNVDAIEIDTNDEDVSVALEGEGIKPPAPDIGTVPTEIGFGARPFGSASGDSFRISNEGNAPLTINSIALAGTGASAYRLSGVPEGVIVLAPNDAPLVLTVVFRPNRTGALFANIVITSNDPDEGTVTVALSGTGLFHETPDISVDQDAVDFGPVLVGAAATETLTITNNGTAVLIISGIALTEDSSPDFSITSDLELPINLASGASAPIDLTYTPGAEGPAAGTLEIQSNDPDEALVSVPLAGTGAATPEPDISVDTDPSLDYGLVQVGDTSTKNATVRNSGGAPLNITISLADGTSPNFSYDGPDSVRLPPRAELPLPVTYAPTEVGFDGGALVIVSEDPDNSPFEVPLSGNGTADAVAHIDIDTNPALDYGRTQVGTTPMKVITVANTGSASLEVTGITLGIGTSEEYSIANGPVLPVSIAPGSQVQVEVTYSPVNEGFDSGTVVIESGDSMAPLIAVSLSGIGVSDGVAQIEVVPDALDFGSHMFGDPVTLGVTVRNVGSVDLDVTVSIGADGSQTFTVAEPTQFSLIPGAETAVEVTFTPTVIAGAKLNVLSIQSNDLANPAVDVSLIAEVAPFLRIAVDPGALDFGNVEIGTSSTLGITITNNGREPVDVMSMALGDGSSAAFSLVAPDPLILERGEELALEVTYSPTAEVTDTGAVQILSNTPATPEVNVPLTGTGVAQAVMQIRVAPRSIEFGETLVGTPVTKDLTILNLGTADLDLSEVVIGDGSSPSFQLTGGPEGMTVEPGGETTVKVTYSPVTPKTDSGIIRIASNDRRRPSLTVSLFGFATGDAVEPLFSRGDANVDGVIDISDVVKTLSFLFASGSVPTCLDAADFNDDGEVDISDGLFTLTVLFGGGGATSLPEGCQVDATSDALPVCHYDACAD